MVAHEIKVFTARLWVHVGTTSIPGHVRPVIIKLVCRIFEISDSNPIQGK